MQNPYLLAGIIVKPQGVRGEVKLRHETDDPEHLTTLDVLYLKKGDAYEPLALLDARVSGNDVYLLLEGVADRDAAEKLRGLEVYIRRDQARPLGEGEMFIVDMIGMRAVDTAGGQIGTLTEVLQNGGTDVLVFATPRGSMMAPFLKRLVLKLDAQAGEMVLDAQVLPEVALYENSDTDPVS